MRSIIFLIVILCVLRSQQADTERESKGDRDSKQESEEDRDSKQESEEDRDSKQESEEDRESHTTASSNGTSRLSSHMAFLTFALNCLGLIQ
nr:unnamed protein product [Fasciola hepatica]